MSLSGAEWSALGLSLQVSLCGSLGLMPLAVGTAVLLRQARLPFRGTLEALVSLPMVLPPVVVGYLLLVLLAPRGVLGFLHLGLTWKAAALAAAIVAFPLAVQTVRLALDELDPRLVQAARTLGASRVRAFATITLPLAARGLVAAWALAFARCLGEFGATIIVAGNIPGQTQTLPLAVFSATEAGHDDQALRLVGLSTLLAFLCLVALGRLYRRSGGGR